MPSLPQFGDSENNLIAKIAMNTGPTPPKIGDGRWSLLYKVCQNTYASASIGIKGYAETYNELPIVADNPPLHSIYFVREATGIPLINRKLAGLYVRKSNNGDLSDWIHSNGS